MNDSTGSSDGEGGDKPSGSGKSRKRFRPSKERRVASRGGKGRRSSAVHRLNEQSGATAQRANAQQDQAETGPHLADARRLAFDALTAWRQRSAPIAQVLDDLFARRGADSQQRNLAREIAAGIVRRQATLDVIIDSQTNRPRADIEDSLWTLLQIGTYQQVMLDGIAEHAAIYETVEVAKHLQKPEWAGFINGTLRSVQALVTEEIGATPTSDGVPLAEGRYRLLTEPLFPDPSADFVKYIVRALSYPRWLARRWVARFGEEETLRIAHWFNTPGSLTLRVNATRANRADVITALEEKNINVAAGEMPEAIHVIDRTPVAGLPEFLAGQISVQDSSAIAAARLLAPQPGERILDLCAAPGGKTMHIAELMENRGTVIATDTRDDRLPLISTSAKRLQLKIVSQHLISEDGSDIPLGPFDGVLVDVPCSNTGVMGKRPEVRWRLREEELEELAALQLRLLTDAIARLKLGGRVVYSTCSIEPEENRSVVDRALAAHPRLHLLEERVHVPGHPGDGAYQALLAST